MTPFWIKELGQNRACSCRICIQSRWLWKGSGCIRKFWSRWKFLYDVFGDAPFFFHMLVNRAVVLIPIWPFPHKLSYSPWAHYRSFWQIEWGENHCLHISHTSTPNIRYCRNGFSSFIFPSTVQFSGIFRGIFFHPGRVLSSPPPGRKKHKRS